MYDGNVTRVSLCTSALGSLVEGWMFRYTATVANLFTGSLHDALPMYGQTITIEVGQTTGYVDYVVRADDAHAQADDSLIQSLAENIWRLLVDVTTAGTVLTGVTDDGDDLPVSLSTIDPQPVVDGSTIG